MNIAVDLTSPVLKQAIEQVTTMLLGQDIGVSDPQQANVVITDTRSKIEGYLKQGKHVIQFWSGDQPAADDIAADPETGDRFKIFAVVEKMKGTQYPGYLRMAAYIGELAQQHL